MEAATAVRGEPPGRESSGLGEGKDARRRSVARRRRRQWRWSGRGFEDGREWLLYDAIGPIIPSERPELGPVWQRRPTLTKHKAQGWLYGPAQYLHKHFYSASTSRRVPLARYVFFFFLCWDHSGQYFGRFSTSSPRNDTPGYTRSPSMSRSIVPSQKSYVTKTDGSIRL